MSSVCPVIDMSVKTYILEAIREHRAHNGGMDDINRQKRKILLRLASEYLMNFPECPWHSKHTSARTKSLEDLMLDLEMRLISLGACHILLKK